MKIKRKSILLVISGPAGSGKTTLCDKLLEDYQGKLSRVITATSRPMRPGEVNGKDYYFFSKEEFETRINRNGFYEHALVHENNYGVPRDEVTALLLKGNDLLLNIDVQGAATVREVAGEDKMIGDRFVSVFIMPTDLEQIRQRMLSRGQDSEEVINRRLQSAQEEIERFNEYDYVIISDTKEEDYRRIQAIYEAETMKSNRLEKA